MSLLFWCLEPPLTVLLFTYLCSYFTSHLNFLSLCSAKLQWYSIQPDAASAEMSGARIGIKTERVTALLFIWEQKMPFSVTWQTPEDLSAFGLVNCILCKQITRICSKYYLANTDGLKYMLKYIFSFCKVSTIQLHNYILSAESEFALFHVLPANRNEIQIYRLWGHDISNPSAGVSSQGVESFRLCPNMNANICLI